MSVQVVATRSSRLVAISRATPVGIGDHPGPVRKAEGIGMVPAGWRAFCPSRPVGRLPVGAATGGLSPRFNWTVFHC